LRICRIISFSLILVCLAFAQPVQKPNLPPEPMKPVPEREPKSSAAKPKIERKIPKQIQPVLSASYGPLLNYSGNCGGIRGGVSYGRFEFGVDLHYYDFSADLDGIWNSYMADGSQEICEKGSFVNPAVYTELLIRAGFIDIRPSFSLGYSSIVTRKWLREDPPDTARFERDRLSNTWSLKIGVPVGPLYIAAIGQWCVINPWFFSFPEDYGFLSAGVSVGMDLRN